MHSKDGGEVFFAFNGRRIVELHSHFPQGFLRLILFSMWLCYGQAEHHLLQAQFGLFTFVMKTILEVKYVYQLCDTFMCLICTTEIFFLKCILFSVLCLTGIIICTY